jgi:hypothetical protein
MATEHKDKLQLLEDATKKIESDETLTFDDVVQLCAHQLNEWPDSTGAKTEIWHLLRAAERRMNRLLAT